ncbi:putative Ig domain-containing protein [Ralstonia psammae]|nr:putative Ig domain-containing protein [Ralstonia sp. LMG 19083]
MAVPHFHMAPIVLTAPNGVDSGAPSASAQQSPASQPISAVMAATSTARLTPQALAAYKSAASPAGTGSQSVTTYTPAQIRAAYGLPGLPATWTGLSASAAAQMGAGQTIYIIDAMSDPNISAELAAFNRMFGLPQCDSTTLSPTTALPLATAQRSGCQLLIAYSTISGAMTSTSPAYDSGWATEIALDVQWAHATAPLARIVLIEAPDASVNSLLGAINLANAMGPGVVSMSFGGAEGNWTAAVDSAFSNASMTYLAATGDSGFGVEWPSVSPKVMAVGGTSLTYSGGARSETVWSGTGGGLSQFTPVPNYQTSAVPGMGALSMRSVADVSFNADPYTGQYLAVLPPGGAGVNWYSAGGTSLATPQWAGIVAIANAVRTQNAQGALGLAQSLFYGKISTNPSLYASAFDDITAGSDGTCGSCTAHAGYDRPSGLGSPNVVNLLNEIAVAPAQAPIVSPVTINGIAGKSLSFSVAVTSPHAVTWSLSNAPRGMSISTSGLVSWPLPIAGTYPVTVTATDSLTGLSGSAVTNIMIASPPAPVVDSATVTAQAGSMLNYQVHAVAADPVTFAMSGAPLGMSISLSGMITWAKPAAGTYSVTVTATDATTGQSGRAVINVQVSKAPSFGPAITATPINGVAGNSVSGTIGIMDPGARDVYVRIQGAPAGMTFGVSGQGILVSWVRPVAGVYTLLITAVDSSGFGTQATLPVRIQ